MKTYFVGRHRRRFLVAAIGLALAVAGAGLATPSMVAAYTSYLNAAVARYPHIDGTALDACILCHRSGSNALNSYGQDFGQNGNSFAAVESFDSDGDGHNNLSEILVLSFPGDDVSAPASSVYLPAIQHNTQ